MNYPGCPGNQFFTENGTFAVSTGVKSVRVLLVGGGGSGYNADLGGGGGGYVECGNVDVSNVTNVSVIVGAGGVIGPSSVFLLFNTRITITVLMKNFLLFYLINSYNQEAVPRLAHICKRQEENSPPYAVNHYHIREEMAELVAEPLIRAQYKFNLY